MKSRVIYVRLDRANEVSAHNNKRDAKKSIYGTLGIGDMCYAGWLKATGIKLKLDKVVGVRLVKTRS